MTVYWSLCRFFLTVAVEFKTRVLLEFNKKFSGILDLSLLLLVHHSNNYILKAKGVFFSNLIVKWILDKIDKS